MFTVRSLSAISHFLVLMVGVAHYESGIEDSCEWFGISQRKNTQISLLPVLLICFLAIALLTLLKLNSHVDS